MYKVMIIDDEPIIVEGLSKSIHWEQFGCEVIGTANDGISGLEIIREEKPDIIFTDICMPEMDGLTMMAALKSEFPNTQLCVLTGFREFDYAQQAIRLGVSRFLLKPSTMSELEEAIRCMVSNLESLNNSVDLKKVENLKDSNNSDKKSCVNEVQEAGQENSSQGSFSGDHASSFIVKNALSYIEAHYQEKLLLSDVADHTYVSQWHLSKLLNRHMGQNFSEILNSVRIDKAKEMLKDPALRIGDIAEAVGFLDMAHFSRVFKKQTGISANQYRNTILS